MTEPKERTDVLVCYGTRPEVIKLSPVIESLAAEGVLFKTLFTGQHDELFEDVAHLILEPHIRLDIMRKGQSPEDVMQRVMAEAGRL